MRAFLCMLLLLGLTAAALPQDSQPAVKNQTKVKVRGHYRQSGHYVKAYGRNRPKKSVKLRGLRPLPGLKKNKKVIVPRSTRARKR